MSAELVSVADVLRAQAEGKPVRLIDVRTPAEHRSMHARGARSVPLDTLDPAAVMRPRGSEAAEPLYILCQSGSRARQAREKFLAAGFPNAVVVEGGTAAWAAAGGPVVRGKQVISLERQVRIAAGTLVVIGAALALAVNLWFILFSAFIGAGLVFAGVTDTCGMGMLLARAPWNQAGKEPAAAGAGAPACADRGA